MSLLFKPEQHWNKHRRIVGVLLVACKAHTNTHSHYFPCISRDLWENAAFFCLPSLQTRLLPWASDLSALCHTGWEPETRGERVPRPPTDRAATRIALADNPNIALLRKLPQHDSETFFHPTKRQCLQQPCCNNHQRGYCYSCHSIMKREKLQFNHLRLHWHYRGNLGRSVLLSRPMPEEKRPTFSATGFLRNHTRNGSSWPEATMCMKMEANFSMHLLGAAPCSHTSQNAATGQWGTALN